MTSDKQKETLEKFKPHLKTIRNTLHETTRKMHEVGFMLPADLKMEGVLEEQMERIYDAMSLTVLAVKRIDRVLTVIEQSREREREATKRRIAAKRLAIRLPCH